MQRVFPNASPGVGRAGAARFRRRCVDQQYRARATPTSRPIWKVKLARYHDDPDSAFWGWNDIWLDPAFRGWNIEAVLPAITKPVLAVQGEDDEYGTMAQVDRIASDVPKRAAEAARCGIRRTAISRSE